MSAVEKISIALPSEMIAVLRSAVNSGEYSSTSEIIREALRAWKLRKKIDSMELEELRNLVREGIEGGPGIDAELVFSSLHAKYAAMPMNAISRVGRSVREIGHLKEEGATKEEVAIKH